MKKKTKRKVNIREPIISGKQKLLISLCMIIFFSFVSAESISNYTIKSAVPIGQNQTITGVYSTQTTDANNSVLCSFSVIDSNDSTLIYRASDQYPQSNGYFSSEFQVKEPLKEFQDYNLVTRCGSVSASQQFNVSYPESLEQPIINSMLWVRDNGFFLIIVLIAVIFGLTVLAFLFNKFL